MDTITNTATKQKARTAAIRATPSQTALLVAAFQASPSPTTTQMMELSGQTALPYKWIASWFGRQRRKVSKKGAVAQQSSDPDEITILKTEPTDFVVPPAPSASTGDVPHKSMKKSQPKKTMAKNPPKIKAKSGPLTRQPIVKIEAKSELVVPQSTNSSSPMDCHLSSTPFLRLPDVTLNTHFDPSSAAFEISDIIPRPAAPRRSALSNVATSSHLVGSDLAHNFPDLHFSYDSDVCRPDSVPPSVLPFSSSVQETLVMNPGSVLELNFPRTPLQPSLHLNARSYPPLGLNEPRAVQNTRAIHPPSQSLFDAGPTLPRYYRSFDLRTHTPYSSDSDSKENFCPTPSPIMPVSFRAPCFKLPTQKTSPLTIEKTTATTAKNHKEDDLTYTLNPSTTPLKHLPLLHPLPVKNVGGNQAVLDKREIVGRLLDERLGKEDPFQAAMGLVFLSRLGMDWDYK